MSNIIPFDFETNAVRVVVVDDAPVFVAMDVCRVLEITKYRDALTRLDDDERVSVLVDTLGGKQTMTAVTESGLYALIMQSRKPAAKRFRKWVTAQVLPAIRRDGSYSLPQADRVELEAKRAYYQALNEPHRARADDRAAALAQIEALIADGARVSAAIAEVAMDRGVSVSTLYNYRRATYMVARDDWAPAMAPRWNLPRGMMAECHPDAMRMFLDLRLSGAKVSDCYRRLVEEARLRGWAVPSERTMQRVSTNVFPRPSKSKQAA